MGTVLTQVELLVADGGRDLLDGELRHLEVGGDRHGVVRGAPEQLQLAGGLRNYTVVKRIRTQMYSIDCRG